MQQFNGFKVMALKDVVKGMIVCDASEWNVEELEADDLVNVDWIEVQSMPAYDEWHDEAWFAGTTIAREYEDEWRFPAKALMMVQD